VTLDRDEAKAATILPGRSLRRWTYALLGLLSVGVGFLGVFVPGLPTTVFLLLASYCFTRSCPWLEDKLVKAPIFRPYLRYLDRDQGMPFRARMVTIAMIWVASATSCLMVWLRGDLSAWFVAAIGTAALIGSIVVARVFRGTVGSDADTVPSSTDAGERLQPSFRAGRNDVGSALGTGAGRDGSDSTTEPSTRKKSTCAEAPPARCPMRRGE
jgi:uncharacterized membrane protein YbaN (DUF454 family)